MAACCPCRPRCAGKKRTCTTCDTSGTSSPRAAASVHTITSPCSARMRPSATARSAAGTPLWYCSTGRPAPARSAAVAPAAATSRAKTSMRPRPACSSGSLATTSCRCARSAGKRGKDRQRGAPLRRRCAAWVAERCLRRRAGTAGRHGPRPFWGPAPTCTHQHPTSSTCTHLQRLRPLLRVLHPPPGVLQRALALVQLSPRQPGGLREARRNLRAHRPLPLRRHGGGHKHVLPPPAGPVHPQLWVGALLEPTQPALLLLALAVAACPRVSAVAAAARGLAWWLPAGTEAGVQQALRAPQLGGLLQVPWQLGKLILR